MTKKAFAVGMKMLEKVYTKFEITNDEQAMDIWYSRFRDIDDHAFIAAVNRYIDTSRFEPTIAGLKDMLPEEYDATTAWERVRQAIRDNRFYRGMPEFDDPVLNKTLRGWSHEELDMMKTSEAGIYRAQFIKAYNANKEAATKPALSKGNGRMKELTGRIFREAKE